MTNKPRTAHFRFYEELNDFLPEKLRRKTFSYGFTGTPSIKDAIEAIGPPHVEVDLILVDGTSVGFNYLMQGGERVSVYPVFESFDISPLIHLRAKPLRESKFVVDVNLGKLARMLRLLGFDVLFENDFSDSLIIELSLKEKRIILTRDKGLLKHSAVTRGYWLRSQEPKQQLKEVVGRLQLENSFSPFTRCSNCNELLHPVDKRLLKKRVPEHVFSSFDDFMECGRCEKTYWRGSHYDRICEWMAELKKQ